MLDEKGWDISRVAVVTSCAKECEKIRFRRLILELFGLVPLYILKVEVSKELVGIVFFLKMQVCLSIISVLEIKNETF